jgi:hypothetical protein
LPHVLHAKGWAILARGLALSPLSVVGPILEADILPTRYLGAVSNLSVTRRMLIKESFYDKMDMILVTSITYVPVKWENI